MGFLTEAFYRMLGTADERSSLAYVGHTATRPTDNTHGRGRRFPHAAKEAGDKTMTNKELLELAAKAAGMNVEPVSQYGVTELFDNDAHREWNPLTDDGDALRLAVDLNLR